MSEEVTFKEQMLAELAALQDELKVAEAAIAESKQAKETLDGNMQTLLADIKDNPAALLKVPAEAIDALRLNLSEMKQYGAANNCLSMMEDEIRDIETLIGMWEQANNPEFTGAESATENKSNDSTGGINMFDNYHARKDEVLRIYDEYCKFETNFKNEEFDTKLAAKADNIRNDKFNLLVAGEAKSGKSTFINAYLGEEILPMDELQCTSALIEINYGEEKTLIATYADNSQDYIKGEQNIRDFLQTHAAIQDEYRNIPVAAINNQILVKCRGEPNESEVETLVNAEKQAGQNLDEYKKFVWKYINEKKDSWEKIVTKIALTYPLSEDIKDVTIIDSPGVNALGLVGNATKEFIAKADALIFTKPLTGSAVDSESFYRFLSTKTEHNSKGELFLILTRKADVATKEGVGNLYKEVVKKYGSKVTDDHILAVDSKMELCSHLCKKKTEDEILDFLRTKGYKTEKGLLLDEADRNKADFLRILAEESGFYELKNMLDKFGRSAKNQQLLGFLKLIGKVYTVLSSKLQEDFDSLKGAKNPHELHLLIEKKKEEIDKIQDKIGDDLEKISNEYTDSETGRIKQWLNDEFEKFIKTIYESKTLDEVKKKVFEGQGILNTFREDLHKQIISECDEKLVKLADGTTLSFESLAPIFTAEDYENIKTETEKNARVEGDYNFLQRAWFWIKERFGVWTDTTEYSSNEHLKEVCKALKTEIKSQQEPQRKTFITDCNKLIDAYSSELNKNAEQRQKEYDDLCKEVQTAEEQQQKKEIITSQLQTIENNSEYLRGMMGALNNAIN
jgi:hypothetical protein